MIAWALILWHPSAFGQDHFFVNPSFEGPAGIAKTPYGWKSYGVGSTPDTQPGAWEVHSAASHGNSYVSMVCRGPGIQNGNKWESLMQELSLPLRTGTKYLFSIDLAHSSSFISSFVGFDGPVNLRIWGFGEDLQAEQMFWESGAVAHAEWRTYHFDVTPQTDIRYFVLEAYYAREPSYCGNILIDNLQCTVEREKKPDPVFAQDTGYRIDYSDYALPEKINGRPVEVQSNLSLKGRKLTIEVWDDRLFDGDTISLFINGRCLLDMYCVSKERKMIQVQLQPDKTYYLFLYAHNLGRIPPNTAAIRIDDGITKQFTTLQSNLSNCGAAKLTLDQSVDEEH